MNRLAMGVVVSAVTLGVGTFSETRVVGAERGRADAVVELGRRLFFDPAVSKSGNNSCASCHDPKHGFSSARTREDDDFSLTRRRSQTLVDAVLSHAFHWDGEFDRIEDLVSARLGSPTARRGAGAGGVMAVAAVGHDAIPVGGGTGGAAPTTPGASSPGYSSGSDASGGGSGDPSTGSTDPKPTSYDKPASTTDGDGGSETGAGSSKSSGGYGSDDGGTEKYGAGNGGCAGFKKPVGTVHDGKRGAADADPESTTPTSSTGAGDPASTQAGAPATTNEGGGSSSSGASTSASSSTGSSTPTESGSTAPSGGTPSWVSPTAPGELPPTVMPDANDPARGVTLVADRVERDGRYTSAFVLAFGSPHVTTARLARAISSFVESIRSTPSAYDRFAAGETDALSASAARGLELFSGKASCVRCHTIDAAHATQDGRATFTDGRYHDTGVAMKTSITHPLAGAGGLLTRAPFDAGRSLTTRNPKEVGAFKTPTLRDVALRAPYMHDGSLSTLEDVVKHYAKGGFADPNLDPAVRGFELEGTDVADLKAFLESLTSEVRPGAAPSWSERSAIQMVRFLDARGRPLVGIPVTIVPAGDQLPGAVTGATERSTVTDANGAISFVPTRGTHARLDLPAGLRMPQGAMVPDTCESLTVRLPIEGTMTLVVSSAIEVEPFRDVVAVAAPPLLSIRMFETLRRFDPVQADLLCRRETTFRSEGSVVVAGRQLTRYRAWVPTGTTERAIIELAGSGVRGRRAYEVRLVAGSESRVEAR